MILEKVIEQEVEHTVITYSNGDQYWTVNNQLHREKGPAVMNGNISQKWYYQDQLHRAGGPAHIDEQGTEYWYEYNKLHRENGPAIVWLDGERQWYYRGIYVQVGNQQDFNKWLKFKAFT